MIYCIFFSPRIDRGVGSNFSLPRCPWVDCSPNVLFVWPGLPDSTVHSRVVYRLFVKERVLH